MLKRLLPLLFLLLTALTPAQKVAVYQGADDCDFSRYPGVTAWLDSSYPASWNTENRFLQSDAINASWSVLNVTAVSASSVKETVTNAAHVIYQSSLGYVSGVTYRIQFEAKPDGRTYAYGVAFDGTKTGAAYFDLTGAGAVTNTYQDAGTTTTAAITALSDGYYRCVLTYTAGATGAGNAQFGVSDNAAQNAAGYSRTYAGDITKGLLLRALQFQSTSNSPTYQPTTTAAVIGISPQRTLGHWNSRVGSVSFTQATAGNQPILTLPTNQENRLLYSEGAWSNTTYWNVSDYPCTASGTTIIASASSNLHGIATNAPVRPALLAGQSYRAIFDVAYGNYQYVWLGIKRTGAADWYGVSVDLNAGTLGAPYNSTATIETIGTKRYRVKVTATVSTSATHPAVAAFTTGANDTDPKGFLGVGTETFTLNSIALQSSLADPTYIATTDTPLYRGVAGRSGVRFNIGNVMTSTATTGGLFLNNAKTFFVAFRTVNTSLTGNIINDAGGYFTSGVTSAGNIKFLNYDGTDDVVERAIVTNAPYVFSTVHRAGNLYAQLNGGSIISAASGNTASTTEAVRLGNVTSNGLNGELADLITANKAWDAATIAKANRCLCKKWGANCQ